MIDGRERELGEEKVLCELLRGVRDITVHSRGLFQGVSFTSRPSCLVSSHVPASAVISNNKGTAARIHHS